MKYALLLSLALNLILFLRLFILRASLKELGRDYSEHAGLDSNTLLGVSCRDRGLCELASRMNDSLRQMRQSYQLYKQGDKRMRDMLTNVAHDIRTPLTAIGGYLELAQRLDQSAEMRKYLDIVGERVRYMKNLAEELFEYLLIRDMEAPADKQDVFLNQLLEDTLMSYYPQLTEKGIEPRVEITEQRIMRKLDPLYTRRVLNNLISNAMKYSAGDLFVRLTETGTLEISNRTEELSPIQVSRLFDRYYTVENAQSGTGLGLSIVRTLLDKMGATAEGEYKDGRLLIRVEFP
ncbi:MAG: HAMP domain-containing histidine kinase [Lachnospiraceae bacterium]|nr:HAMP domain-containing histidine kinase [Lachnospiraceae bacterium]